MRFQYRATVAALFALALNLSAFAAESEPDVWSKLRSGEHIALLRHALAPGTGDPANFALRDCATQRNLSDQGREQAVLIGEQFRENGIDSANVYSSQWCRCLETARLLKLGGVNEQPALNSFFRNFEKREPQTLAIKNWIGTWLSKQDLSKPLVLISHQVNITALTGVYPASGEMVVIHVAEDGELSVAGTIEF